MMEDDQFDVDNLLPSESSIEDESESVQDDEYYGQARRQLAAAGDRRAPRQLWLISYSDFMTILMIFFLAMYGYTYLAKEALIHKRHNQRDESEFAASMETMKGRLGDQMKVQNDVDKVRIQLSEQILFPSGSAKLGNNAAATLEELANSVKLVDGDVIVEGHTDNVPVGRGRFKSNWELSAARAFSVIEALIDHGVPAERLAAWGFGENRPVASNETPQTRTQNRRIEVVILKKKTV